MAILTGAGGPALNRFRAVLAPMMFLALAFIAVAVDPASLYAQISPGPLAKAHESLSGTSQCASCHQFGASTPAFRCLDCHTEIAHLLSTRSGYHAQLQIINPNGKDCVRCHLDHNGADFPLIHWEPPLRQFDHRLTGYPLEAKHAGLRCEQCHLPANMVPADRSLIKRGDLTKSFLGLSKDCVPCHADPHKGQLGSDCQRCHNVNDWKAAKQFDHSKTRYPLTGLHTRVTCEKCHKPDAPGGPARFKGMNFGACIDCHRDPHRGAFKQRCEDCHATASWKNLRPAFAFDHSQTKFPLLGLHAKVGCTACHSNGDFKRPMAYENCVDCHKTDPHNGQFAGQPNKGECAECHTVNGWKPSLFGVKEHAASKYPLQGKHAKVECSRCHIPAGKDTLYKIKFANCSDCHQDAHAGQFARAPYRDRCETCHTVQDFHRSLFTIAKHRATKFPLAGAHAAVACIDCHKVGAGQRTDKIIPFQFEDQTCTACHTDPHGGEFQERMAQKRADGRPLGCEACHGTKSWADVNGFDHSRTKFPLLGAHRTVVCGACHKPAPGTRETQFKGLSQECDGCHTDPHGRQFVSNSGKTVCADCHTVERWVPSTFNHDARTRFPLQGGHAHMACDQCHNQTRVINEKEIIFYKPTPLQCAACHVVDPGPLNPKSGGR